MKPKLREIIDLLIELNYLAVVFLIPVWFAYFFPTYGIFELNKVVLFRSLLFLLFGLTILKIGFFGAFWRAGCHQAGGRLSRFLKKYFLWPGLFIAALGLSIFFSIDPSHSFFGSFARQQGFSTFLFYFLWLILLVLNLLTVNNSFILTKRRDRGRASAGQTEVNSEIQIRADGEVPWNKAAADTLKKRIRRFIITMALSGGVVSVYGILQFFNIDFLAWSEPAWLTKRAFSTLGQPNFLASYLLLVIPLSVYLWHASRSFRGRLFWVVVVISQLMALFFTGSRGGELALVIVLAGFLSYLLIFHISNSRKKIIFFITSLIVLATIIGGAFYLAPERFRNSFDSKAGSVAARVFFYQAAAAAILEKPWFGYGLENSGQIFINYYEPDWGIYNKVGASTDRAHNLVLDILLTSGFWGLICFSALYYWFFKIAWENVHRDKTAFLSLALISGAAAYLLSLFFNFSILVGEVYWWSFLALVVVINYSRTLAPGSLDNFFRPESYPNKKSASSEGAGFRQGLGLRFRHVGKSLIIQIIIVSLAGLIVFLGIRHNFKILAADHYFYKLANHISNQETGQALVLAGYIRRSGLNPSQQGIYDNYLGHYLSTISRDINQESLAELVRREQYQIFISLPEQGYLNLLTKAELAGSLGAHHLARAYFSAVQTISPYWPRAYLAEAEYLFAEGDWFSARRAYLLADGVLPDLNNQYINQEHGQLIADYKQLAYQGAGDTYFQENNYSAAAEFYKRAYRYGPQDLNLLKKIADAYYQLGYLDQALFYDQHGLIRNPQDYAWPRRLSLIYQAQGKLDLADYYRDLSRELGSD